MSMEKLLELEKKINEYMVEVAEDQIIDTQEIIKLAKHASNIVDEIDKDGIVDDEEEALYERVSAKLKALFKKYDVIDFS